ncbi:MAG: nucleotidyl transferase AbiEii/AbiGii toxin family protein [Lachnospiraceae bacterium]|jgi:hypothetical protein|nr:nucleotidyl transferase AbiEii/AbiGii toxin family protein [Lachnospiraceae bacterium]
MTLRSQYYEESLYPLQDGVLDLMRRSDTDFFLTGGTAISRAYYNHRYSDDLDFFVTQSSPDSFDAQTNKILNMLKSEGYTWDTVNNFLRSERFVSLSIYKESNTLLKLDFINDSVPRFGSLVRTDLFHRTDCVRNILSNKLSAIFRFEAKDIADIREITLNNNVDWVETIRETREKDEGIELVYVAEILKSFPRHEFDKIAWVKEVKWETFQNDIDKIAFDMLNAFSIHPT